MRNKLVISILIYYRKIFIIVVQVVSNYKTGTTTEL